MVIKNNNGINDYKNKANVEQDDGERLDLQPSREGLRPRICASRLRRLHVCACGRTRALDRQGHHWRRLSACSHCMNITDAPSRLVDTTSCKESGND